MEESTGGGLLRDPALELGMDAIDSLRRQLGAIAESQARVEAALARLPRQVAACAASAHPSEPEEFPEGTHPSSGSPGSAVNRSPSRGAPFLNSRSLRSVGDLPADPMSPRVPEDGLTKVEWLPNMRTSSLASALAHDNSPGD